MPRHHSAVSGADTTLSIADAQGTEGPGATVDFPVTLNAASTGTVSVDYATQDTGSATAGSDYTATSGTLTFDPGDTSMTISVPIIDDTVNDSGETFEMVLSNAVGAEIADSVATGTILNTEDAVLSASFPDSAFTSSSHSGTDDRPQVVVTFSEAVASFAADTPAVSVTGATVSSVQAHTEDGLDNAHVFFLIPVGDGDVTFALATDAACASGGICTADGTVLTQAPAALTILGPDAAADADETEEAPEASLTASFENVPSEHDGSTRSPSTPSSTARSQSATRCCATTRSPSPTAT